MSDPLISIVLCCYNGKQFIKQQIDSLLDQTYPNIEIIISDDASADGTVQILEEFRSEQRIQLFFQPTNLGSSRNFEFAVGKTHGELIAFSDQDDIWLPSKVAPRLSFSPIVFSMGCVSSGFLISESLNASSRVVPLSGDDREACA